MGSVDYNRNAKITAVLSEASKAFAQNPATAIPAAGSETVQYFAPAGTIAQLYGVAAVIPAPVGAGSGTHELYVALGAQNILKGATAYNKELSFLFGEWQSTVDTSLPSDKAGQQSATKGVFFDNDDSVQFIYYNKTNIEQTNTRNYRAYYLERKVT